ncbi:MAG: hypothetical protein UV59_C0013G0011 [Candidatus Gottesmanbacteria bacterium GW2011_GWA1_43_11]|uniref:Uncharacterized protein n=1 Tax=Candidatus Gottesmanbacteria bacterium GW2011_GWA1_43_11 TaxID=1618436 RepID=A0A0G1FD95_9BACT|nr:MAG: hypothetical protein UV59_C0013G0011 [Candidatus Gottesmanbacteria bacterium GW2011_GWA1_43_11]
MQGSLANGSRWRDFAEAQDSLAKRDPALQDLPRLNFVLKYTPAYGK